MAEQPTFSVVIAAHNAAATLPATIRSVLQQTRQDFEVLVVDDGSVDDTEAALRRTTDDPRVSYTWKEQSGPADSRNAGIAAAQGAFVCLLDSDDMWLPTYLQAIAAAFDADPGAALAYTDAWVLDDDTRRIFRKPAMAMQNPPGRPPRDPQDLLVRMLQANFVYTSATVRRPVLLDVGGFKTFARSEDYELWVRIAANGHRFVRTVGRHALYRVRSGSRVHDRRAMLQGRFEIYDHIVRTYDLAPAARAVAEMQLQRAKDDMAAAHDAQGALEMKRSALKRSALWRLAHSLRHLRRRPPREVARAFPDLHAV
jgi:glycosyltransferase involved in cell wall biosynthesis